MQDEPDRPHLPWALPALLVALCAAEAVALFAPTPRPPVLAPAPRPELTQAARPLPEALRGEPGFTARMTPDDVARGVQALAALPADAPEHLSAEQRLALAPIAAEAASLKARLGALRMQRRALEQAWVEGAAVRASALPPALVQAAAPELKPTPSAPPPPSPPERR